MSSAMADTDARAPFKAGHASEPDLPDDMLVGTCVATSAPAVRLGFIRKVYGILAAQLLVTTVICGMFMYVPPLRRGIIAAGGALQLILVIASFGTIFGLLMNKDSHPANMRWLFAFTAVESCLVGYICALYQANGLGALVLEALALTLAIFGGLTAYCFISKKDFSFMGGALFAGLFVLIGAGFVNLILGVTGNRSPFFAMLVACGGALLFSLYILYDSTFSAHVAFFAKAFPEALL